jgi:hypothetical protein
MLTFMRYAHRVHSFGDGGTPVELTQIGDGIGVPSHLQSTGAGNGDGEYRTTDWDYLCCGMGIYGRTNGDGYTYMYPIKHHGVTC